MPKGHSLSIYAQFSGKRRTSLYICREKGVHYYIPTRHNDLFFAITIFFWKNFKKNQLATKARVRILSEYIESCSCPLGIP